MKKIIDNQKRYVSVAEYQRLSGLSYPTVRRAIASGELKAVTTEAGHYRIDTQGQQTDYSVIIERLDRQEQLIKALSSHFGVKA